MAPAALWLLPLAFVAVLADGGYYIPKAYFTIDRDGRESPLTLLNQVFRPKRNTVISTSSSSSSSSNGFGQSQTYSVSGAGVYAGGPPVPGYQQPIYTNTYNPGIQAVPLLINRFGDDGISGVGIVGTSQGAQGVYSSSSSIVDSDGKVHYASHTGRL